MMFRVLNKTLNKTPKRKKRRERGGKETLQFFRCKNNTRVVGKRIVHNNRRSTYVLTPFPFVLVRSSSNKTALYYSKRERERERERVLRLWRRRRRTPDDENGFDDSFRRD